MDERLFEAFEACVRALEAGADLESVLKLYPDLAVKLRPLLETADRARMMSVSEVPQDVMKRGRAKVLQHATAMREAAAESQKTGFVFRRWATSLVLALVFLLGGTGVVKASSGALPGDNLYPVKRAWEEIRLWLEFSPAKRETLVSEYEQERLDEIGELLAEGREETITFSGIVTAQDDVYWIISDVPVQVTASTKLPVETVSIGAPVTVVGRTNVAGFIQAQEVSLLESGASLPPLESEELEKREEENVPEDDENQQRRTYKFQGVVTSQQGNFWIINGQRVNVSQAEIKGEIAPGDFVEFEGYYDKNREFMAIWIELKAFSQDPSENENLNNNSDDDTNDNTGDDDDDNDNDNTNNNNGNDDDDDTRRKDNDDDDDKDNDNDNGGDDDDGD